MRIYTSVFYKRHYSVIYACVSTALVFANLLLLFGLWHAYKYCVTECYRRFLPLWVALEYRLFLTDPNKLEVVTKFNLSMIVGTVLFVFLRIK